MQQQSLLKRDRLVASELGRSLIMSPVVTNTGISVASDESSMPLSLVVSADHVAQQLELLRQSLSVLADITERQNNAVQLCNGVVQSAEKKIDTAKRV